MFCFTFFSKQIDSVFSMLVVNARPTRTSKSINALTILLVHFISLISDITIPLKKEITMIVITNWRHTAPATSS